ATARDLDLDRAQRLEAEVEDPELAVGVGFSVLEELVGVLDVGRRLDVSLVGVLSGGEPRQCQTQPQPPEERQDRPPDLPASLSCHDLPLVRTARRVPAAWMCPSWCL